MDARRRLLLATLATLALGALAGTAAGVALSWTRPGERPDWNLAAGGAVVCTLAAASVLLARRVAPVVGRATTSVLVGLIWAAVLGAAAALAGQSAEQVAYFALSGFMVPLIAAVAVLPLMFLVRAAQGLRRRRALQRPVTRRRRATHYEVLGVGTDATPAEVRNAAKRARAAARRHGTDDDLARVEAARDVLSDTAARATYDEQIGSRRHRRRQRTAS